MTYRILVLLAVLALALGASACGSDPTEEAVPEAVPTADAATVQAEASEPEPTAEPTDEPTTAPSIASSGVEGVEFTSCEALIAEGEAGLGADFAVGMYAYMLAGVLAGEPVNGEVIELTDEQRAVWQAALDSITVGDTYCGVVPIEPE